ncbi:hypothetical protein [Paenibacillus sp. PAMC 26794]|uniref:hypothetical protein n=1 Tax=Paenibacillus sp. PAMC 26794 TaxID=1257080 RepID=UPI000306F420|nr:hypothetical protein [Paenibacillus sp. PAMC 26794]
MKDLNFGKPFEWQELNGKTLQILAGTENGTLIVVGRDVESHDLYVLHTKSEKEMIKEDIQAYMKQREKRLQEKNPGRFPSKLRALFIDTDESLSIYPKVEEGADKHEPV